jgi:RNA polymerase sigma-70 factor (ECF subfamily)
MTFHSTRWSLVSAAARWKPGGENEPAAQEALETLCAAYWKPLHAYARRRADSEESARDLLQSFFVHVLEKGVFAAPKPQRGRFRAFLTASLRNFMTNEVRNARASKRGGGALPLSLESPLETEGTLRLADLASHDDTPERAFDRAWALAVLERALGRLRREQEQAGKAAAFQRLRPLLTQQATEPLRGVAEELGTTEGALKVALHRLRQRYGELLREEVAGTLSDPAEVEDELRALFAALAQGNEP